MGWQPCCRSGWQGFKRGMGGNFSGFNAVKRYWKNNLENLKPLAFSPWTAGVNVETIVRFYQRKGLAPGTREQALRQHSPLWRERM